MGLRKTYPPGYEALAKSRGAGIKDPSPTKKKQGRPSSYDPTVCCALVLAVMAEGATQTELAAELGIDPWTIRDWKKRHPEFADAVAMGEELCESWWLQQGRKNLQNPHFNAALWLMNMQNRFGWTRRIEGRIDTNITAQVDVRAEVRYDLSQLGTAELEQLRTITAKCQPPATDEADRRRVGRPELIPFHPSAVAVGGE